MLDTPEPRRCSGCGMAEGDRQTLRKATLKRPASVTTVVLRPVRIGDWQRQLCARCAAFAAKSIEHAVSLHLTR